MSFALDPAFGQEAVDPGPPVSGHMAPRPDGYTGIANLNLLGSAALSDLLSQNPLSDADLSSSGFYLNVSDFYLRSAAACLPFQDDPPAQDLLRHSGIFRREAGSLVDMILQRAGIGIRAANRMLHFGGHAGFVQLLEHACRQMEVGAFNRCIVGGIDSCVEPTFLKSAALLRLLRTPENAVGFIAGEAAAFILLEHMPVCADSADSSRMEIASLSYDRDRHSYVGRDPALGEGIAATISAALAAGQDRRSAPGLVVADLNGTERRAIDWSYAAMRLSPDVNLRDSAVWIPALSFGETGATIGFQALCLIKSAFERQYAGGNDALAWFASDNGDRSAIYLRY
jgi:3-oxoacyl-[acyl-carrier-protein] synthase-1